MGTTSIDSVLLTDSMDTIVPMGSYDIVYARRETVTGRWETYYLPCANDGNPRDIFPVATKRSEHV
jgi:hypothetical protein